MNSSDETLKKSEENDAVLQAIADLARTVVGISNDVKHLSKRFDKLENQFDNLEKFATVPLDKIQERINYNSAEFFRMEAKFFDVCSDVSNMRADVKKLNQAVRKKERELV